MRALLASALLAVPAAVPAQPRAGVESITYETGPCFGRCAAFRFTVRADGAGIFEGTAGSARPGRHAFRVTRAQYQAFARQLAPARPTRGNLAIADTPLCGGIRTDQSTTVVTWHPARGPAQQLNFYHGCTGPRAAALDAIISAAPGRLPLVPFIRPGAGRR